MAFRKPQRPSQTEHHSPVNGQSRLDVFLAMSFRCLRILPVHTSTILT